MEKNKEKKTNRFLAFLGRLLKGIIIAFILVFILMWVDTWINIEGFAQYATVMVIMMIGFTVVAK